jgi:hypothetical protein
MSAAGRPAAYGVVMKICAGFTRGAVALVAASGVVFAGAVQAANGISQNGSTTTAGKILSPAPAAGRVSFGEYSYGASQSGGRLYVTVYRYGGSSGAISASYATLDGTAKAGTDYTATQGSLSWAAGDTSPKNVIVPISDTSAQPYRIIKTFALRFTGITGGADLGVNTAAVLIHGGTAGKVAFAATSYSTKQSGGTVTLSVNRSGGSGAAMLSYTTADGSAVSGSDYTATHGTLAWGAGDTSAKTISVPILNTSANPYSGSRNFAVQLYNAIGGAVMGSSTATVTIAGTASSSSVAGSLSLAATSYSAKQAGGTVTVTVARSGGGNAATSVHYATANGSAVAGTDYTAAGGTLNWAAGDTSSKSFTVAIANTSSTPYSGSKSFGIALSSPANGATLGTSNATVSIAGSGAAAAAGSLSLGANSYSSSQSGGTVTVTVARSSGSAATSVHYATANGSAVAGTDYTAASGTLSWAAGDTAAKSFNVAVANTSAKPYTGSKSFAVALSSPGNGATLGTGESTVSIDGTGVAGGMALSSASYSAKQSGGSVTVTVARTGGGNTAASVTYATADGSAKAGTDYTATNGTLSWTAGDTASKSFTVSVANTSASPYAGSKSFTVALSNPTAGASLGGTSSGTVSIGGTGTSTAQIAVDASSNLAPIVSTQMGNNLGNWWDVTLPGTAEGLVASGVHVVRWPGGSNSDAYHWQTNTSCPSSPAWNNPNSDFDTVMGSILEPNSLEAVVTVNYGSNANCNGGGSPSEAAAWVAHAKSKGYNIRYWTVGNEVYGGWEFDLHSKPNDAATYVSAVSGSNGYYQQMKAQDPNAQVGIVVEAESGGFNYWDGWDAGVLGCVSPTSDTTCSSTKTSPPFDYVEVHWYAQQPFNESDDYLLNQAPTDFTNTIKMLRSELVATGHSASTPIMVGELNSVAYNPGKQTLSIVNALFSGMVFGEILNDNVPIATYWYGYGGGGCNTGGNNDSSLYGWQDFGSYDEVSSGFDGCGSNNLSIPNDTQLPNSYAQMLASQFALPGNHMLKASVASGLSDVRAYAATQGSGYSLMLFNLNKTATTSVTVGLSNASGNSFQASTVTYGKAQYDASKNNVWSGPVSKSLGSVSGNFSVSLPPWSMTVVKLQ